MTAFREAPEEIGFTTTSVFEYWVSFWPVAPYFGVAWRFAPMFAPFTPIAEMYERSVDRMLSAAGDQLDKSMQQSRDTALATVETVTETVTETTVHALEEAAEVMQAPRAATEAFRGAEISEVLAPPAPVDEAVLKPVPAPVAEALDEVADAAPAPLESDMSPAPMRPANLLDAAPDDADNLKEIKGIGPKLEEQLNGLGVYKLSQIAGFSEEDLRWIDENLTAFKGRCFRDDWVARAKDLMA